MSVQLSWRHRKSGCNFQGTAWKNGIIILITHECCCASTPVVSLPLDAIFDWRGRFLFTIKFAAKTIISICHISRQHLFLTATGCNDKQVDRNHHDKPQEWVHILQRIHILQRVVTVGRAPIIQKIYIRTPLSTLRCPPSLSLDDAHQLRIRAAGEKNKLDERGRKPASTAGRPDTQKSPREWARDSNPAANGYDRTAV